MTEITTDTINNDDNSDVSLGESLAGSGDWTDQLTLNKNGRACNTLCNMRLILENDEDFQGIVFNQLADDLEIRGSVPWNHTSKYWRDVDDAQLMCLVDERYGSFTQNNYGTRVTVLSMSKSCITESGKSIRDRDMDTGSWKKQFAGLKRMKV